MDISQDCKRVQLLLNRARTNLTADQFYKDHELFRRGDWVMVSGTPGRSQKGELSVLADSAAQLLAPCLHPLPAQLDNAATRMHNRTVDLLVNKSSRDILLARSHVVQVVRRFLETRGFVEVSTPILAAGVGGANAEPFSTTLNETKSHLHMRVAPELWLKRLIIAGFDKVFEIGPCFRNEGLDAAHNPEFTTCEFYQSFIGLDQLKQLTENLLVEVAQSIVLKFPQFRPFASCLLDKPFRTLDFVTHVERVTGQTLPSELTTHNLLGYCDQVGVNGLLDSENPTPAKLLDRLCKTFIEPSCLEPTFIEKHPHCMAPLAKSSVARVNGVERELSHRFELLINQREYINAYEEENSPHAQETKLGLDKSTSPDSAYLGDLEWGLPPTGGWGLGIDRLTMLVTGASRIEQVLSFGGLRVLSRRAPAADRRGIPNIVNSKR